MMYLPLLILIRANLRVAQPSAASTFVPDKAFKNTELSQRLQFTYKGLATGPNSTEGLLSVENNGITACRFKAGEGRMQSVTSNSPIATKRRTKRITITLKAWYHLDQIVIHCVNYHDYLETLTRPTLSLFAFRCMLPVSLLRVLHYSLLSSNTIPRSKNKTSLWSNHS
jgi:hypothetical protein